jgi:two-component system chemotaxis response regulator CheY
MSTSRRGLSGLTALVVDDSAAVRKQVGLTLQRIGLNTVEAEDGAAAWRQLQAGDADIILTDVNMPVMDGLKLISLVRSVESHQRTPIVVITSESADEDRRRAEGLGASAYLLKPVQVHRLVRVVRRLLSHEERDPEPSGGAGEPQA